MKAPKIPNSVLLFVPIIAFDAALIAVVLPCIVGIFWPIRLLWRSPK